ncbi:MAG: M48 family metallopeptidase [Acidobacteria bacterium]|nr:M48 family metallopeptidase [Acidobacteriota bacterium]MBS1864979.1 M48 family metallopeptidase [Acidobacteriota bacterium]
MMRKFMGLLLLLCVLSGTAATAQSGQIPPSSSQTSTAEKITPQPPAKKFTGYSLSPELYKKSKRLAAIRFSFRIFSFLFSLFALWLILRLKWSAQFRDWAERTSRNRTLQALIFAPLFAITYSLLELPLDLFNESLFKRYGISVQPWSAWTADWLKGLLLTVIFGTLLIRILFAVIRSSPQRWWFYFWIISIPISLAIFFVQPLVIDPMFSKFEPLATKAPALIPQLERLTVRGGMPIPPERMFWMLASDKTIFTNAYVTGFGATKRVVIWDTTIDKETTDGILLMFGHEMGHYALNHVPKELAFSSLLVFFLLYVTYLSIGWLLARGGAKWALRGLDDWAALPALLLVVTFFGFFAMVLATNVSRFYENQADVYSLEVTHGYVSDPGQACAASYQMYGEQVFAEPDPNPINVFMFYDHPPVAERVQLCLTYDPWSKGESPQFVK